MHLTTFFINTRHCSSRGPEMTGKINRTVVVKPTGFVFRKIHDTFLPLIEGDHSNMMVAQFQRAFGLQANGKVTSIFFNYLFRLASTTGEEIFGLMPLLFWLMLPVAIPFSTNFLSILMIGQLLKDFIMLPRPLGNCDKWKIVKLDPTFETEYGMPSTHTMTGWLPMTVVQALSRQGFTLPVWGWVSALVYMVIVGLSRLYLGVHSVYDVVAGALLGGLIILLTNEMGDTFEHVMLRWEYGIVLILIMFIGFVTVYPKPCRAWAASYGTSSQVFGTWLGVSLSLWYQIHHHQELWDTLVYTSVVPCSQLYFDPSFRSTTALSPSAALAARMGVASVTAAVFKVGLKPLFVKFFTTLLKSGVTKILPGEEKDVFGREVPIAKAYWVEVPVRLINYGGLAWSVVYLTPLLWRRFDLV